MVAEANLIIYTIYLYLLLSLERDSKVPCTLLYKHSNKLVAKTLYTQFMEGYQQTLKLLLVTFVIW